MLYIAVYSTVNSKLYTIQFSNNLQGMKGNVFKRLGQLSKFLSVYAECSVRYSVHCNVPCSVLYNVQ